MRLIVLAVLAQVSRAEPAADPARQVVVLVNENVPESAALGALYARRRGIPAEQILRVRTSAEEAIGWPDFREQLLRPFVEFVGRRPEALYCAVMYGVPVRLLEENLSNDDPSGGAGDTHARAVANRDYGAVDRELELARLEHPIEGWVRNPVFGRPAAEGRQILVSRLDGPSAEAARGLLERALAAEAFGVEGHHVLDTRGLKEGAHAEADAAMRRIREVFAAARLELQHEDTERVVDLGAVREPGHYWGWYAAAPAWSGPVRFRAGAVGVHLDPLAAREVRSAARGWVGPLVEAGVTATAGTVYEPTDAGLPDGALFFERFLAGASFAEAMTSASRFTSWTALFVGDPLYAPYAAGAAHRQEANRARVTAGPAELEAALDAGRAPEAAGWRELAELLEPEHPLAFLVREARAREDGGKAAGSVAQLREALRRGEPERALRISPANFEANLQTGRAQLEARQTAAAIRSLERARGVEPNSAEARMLLARAYLAGRRAEEAQAEAEAAFGLSVSTAAQRLLAEVLAARGNHAEACVHLRRVHRADPGRAGPAVELARSCLKIGRAAEAVDALEASMGDLPEDAEGGRRMLEQARLLEEAARDAKDEKRHRATQEIVRQWRLGEAPPRDLEAVGRALEELARSEPRALDPLRESAEPVEGVPRVWVGSRHIEPVEILVVGPSARRARLEPLGATGKEAVTEWRLLPGIYRVAVVVGKGSARRIFVRRQRIEAGRGYGLAVDENDRLYLPAPPR